MRKEVYVCDHCGKIFHSTNPYVLEIPYTVKVEAIIVQDRVEWHYCSDCWKVVKDWLTNKPDETGTLKKENERLKKEISWYEKLYKAIVIPNNPFSGCGYCVEDAKL